jgi:ribose 5-phosphate isomerase A
VSDLRALKIDAARAALPRVTSGMKLGLGTGSTAEEFVKLLGEAVVSGDLRDLICVGTSNATEELARSLGLKVVAIADEPRLDLAVDGADEIDPQLRLVKGRGGALLREKIVEQAAASFIVIADHTKLVERLGVGPFPVEVVRFASAILLDRLGEAGFEPILRMKGDGAFVTDEGHHILDLSIGGRELGEAVAEIRRHAGVVDTGFFPDEATEAFIASPSGVEHRRR